MTTNWGWHLPPGVTDRDTDGPQEEPRPCGCTQDCDCDGPNPKPERAVGAQDALAFETLSGLPGAKWLPLPRLCAVLDKFGHSEQWSYDLARAWMKQNSKLVKK